MLVIMDVDLIAQERVEFGYSSGSAHPALCPRRGWGS